VRCACNHLTSFAMAARQFVEGLEKAFRCSQVRLFREEAVMELVKGDWLWLQSDNATNSSDDSTGSTLAGTPNWPAIALGGTQIVMLVVLICTCRLDASRHRLGIAFQDHDLIGVDQLEMEREDSDKLQENIGMAARFCRYQVLIDTFLFFFEVLTLMLSAVLAPAAARLKYLADLLYELGWPADGTRSDTMSFHWRLALAKVLAVSFEYQAASKFHISRDVVQLVMAKPFTQDGVKKGDEPEDKSVVVSEVNKEVMNSKFLKRSSTKQLKRSTSSQSMLSLDSKLEDLMNNRVQQLEDGGSSLVVAKEIFKANLPWHPFTSHDVFQSSLKRAMIFICYLNGTLAAVVLFASPGATKKSRTASSECSASSSIWATIAHRFVVVVVASFLADVPTAMLANLNSREFKYFSPNDEDGIKRQLRKWRKQDLIFWMFAISYSSCCIFFCLLFLANVTQNDAGVVLYAVGLQFLEEVVIFPLCVAVIMVLIMTYINCHRDEVKGIIVENFAAVCKSEKVMLKRNKTFMDENTPGWDQENVEDEATDLEDDIPAEWPVEDERSSKLATKSLEWSLRNCSSVCDEGSIIIAVGDAPAMAAESTGMATESSSVGEPSSNEDVQVTRATLAREDWPESYSTTSGVMSENSISSRFAVQAIACRHDFVDPDPWAELPEENSPTLCMKVKSTPAWLGSMGSQSLAEFSPRGVPPVQKVTTGDVPV